MAARGKIPVYSVYPNEGHSPLALGMLISYASSYKQGLLNEAYQFIPDLLTSVEKARQVVSEHGPGVLLCSNYCWTHVKNHAVASEIKKAHPTTLVICGGPSVPKYDYACEQYFAEHPEVDVAVRGEGEVVLAEVLECVSSAHTTDRAFDALAGVDGLAYRPRGQRRVVRTPDRARAMDLDVFPSPYLNGWFTDADSSRWFAAIVETNRGCPYGCAFCDWGSATLSKVRPFDMDRVTEEIEWIGRNRIAVLWIADANFGIWPRDVDIARCIASVKARYGFPGEVIVNYAKHGTERLAQIIEILCDAGIAANAILAIQTQDPTTLKIINRSNIGTTRYDELLRIFKSQGLPVSSDLMLGLPGATIASFKSDLQFFFDRQVFAKVYPTYVLPNSPMGHRDYMAAYRIRTDATGRILSTISFTAEEREVMERISGAYTTLVGYSLLKYLLYYWQVDHGVPAIAVVDALSAEATTHSDQLPVTAELLAPPGFRRNWERTLYGWPREKWSSYLQEVVEFVERRFDIACDSASRALITVQLALMPRHGRALPERVEVEHDVVMYFDHLRALDNIQGSTAQGLPRLIDYGPCMFEVTDEESICAQIADRAKFTYDFHRIFWELNSPLRGRQGVSHFFQLPVSTPVAV